MRYLMAVAAVLAAAELPAAESAATPPAGRYRCYQPPNFTVVAWFDLYADGRYGVQYGPEGRYEWDAKRSLLRWRGGDFADGRAVGIFMPPGAKHGDHDRATIVLAPRDTLRPGQAGWERLRRCYLTTH